MSLSIQILIGPALAEEEAEPKPSQQQFKFAVVTSLVWHGDHIFPHNLQAIQEIRQKYPTLRLWHFISPNYFLVEDEEERARRAQLIRSVTKEEDYFGLYLEARPQLLERAGVLFRARPSFFRGDKLLCTSVFDCQHDAMLSIYSEADLVKIFTTSAQILFDNGFPVSERYMNRFWEGERHITQAALQMGFKQDYSAIPPSHLSRRLQPMPGFSWLEANWKLLNNTAAQPYWRKIKQGRMLVVPQSAGVLDFSTPKEIMQRFQTDLLKIKEENRTVIVFQLVWHQETANIYRPRLENTFHHLKQLAEREQARVLFQLPNYL